MTQQLTMVTVGARTVDSEPLCLLFFPPWQLFALPAQSLVLLTTVAMPVFSRKNETVSCRCLRSGSIFRTMFLGMVAPEPVGEL